MHFTSETRLDQGPIEREFTLGDIVRIEETKPISKTKTWQVIDRVTAGGTQAVEADLEVEAAGN